VAAAHPEQRGPFVDLRNRHGIPLLTTTAGRPLATRPWFRHSLTLASSRPRSVPGNWTLVSHWGDGGECLVRDLLSARETVGQSKLAAVARFSRPARPRDPGVPAVSPRRGLSPGGPGAGSAPPASPGEARGHEPVPIRPTERSRARARFPARGPGRRSVPPEG
jgi:hypothetical protein